jgi:hypothetical protein
MGKEGVPIRVKRLGAPLRTIPASPHLHDFFIPNEERIESAVREMLA